MKIPRHIKTASIGSKILYDYSFIHYVLITRHVCTDDAFHTYSQLRTVVFICVIMLDIDNVNDEENQCDSNDA